MLVDARHQQPVVRELAAGEMLHRRAVEEHDRASRRPGIERGTGALRLLQLAHRVAVVQDPDRTVLDRNRGLVVGDLDHVSVTLPFGGPSLALVPAVARKSADVTVDLVLPAPQRNHLCTDFRVPFIAFHDTHVFALKSEIGIGLGRIGDALLVGGREIDGEEHQP